MPCHAAMDYQYIIYNTRILLRFFKRYWFWNYPHTVLVFVPFKFRINNPQNKPRIPCPKKKKKSVFYMSIKENRKSGCIPGSLGLTNISMIYYMEHHMCSWISNESFENNIAKKVRCYRQIIFFTIFMSMCQIYPI